LSAQAGDFDHSPPELTDHLPPVVNGCFHVAYIIELQTGQKWSRLPAFTPYKTYITKTVPMLENLTGYFKAADGQIKRKILGCIFSEKLVFEKVLLR